MAYINVAEWTTVEVTDWLKGLDSSMDSYVYSFTNNGVNGRQLLNIRPYELEQLGMQSIGHQEIVLEAVENLRNFHYNLDKENLQFMALHVATAARCLHRQLANHHDASEIETRILNDISRTVATIKPLIGWLARAPFQGQRQFTELCSNMLRLGVRMAMIAQRDRFVADPVEQITETAFKLDALANYIIQDITDPMVLQPASLNLVTLKKRDSELGFEFESNYHGIHRVIAIKQNSPAHNSGKIEDGDEIVQINYQTVVAWRYKKVLMQLHESTPDVLLTLKKRPKHTKIYGQIYMQPYRLPSKKRATGTRWGENVPSPRANLLTVPDDLALSLKAEEKATVNASSDTDSSCSDILTPTDAKATEKEIRLYYPKPRTMLQRRNTISGDELLSMKCIRGIPAWHERKTGIVGDPASPSLRDKSVSFGFGLDAARPTTCIGIATGAGMLDNGEPKGRFGETIKLRQTAENDSQTPEILEERSKPGVSKVVRFDANMKYEDYPVDDKYKCNVENTILETFEPILFADEEEDDVLGALESSASGATKDILDALEKVSQASGGSVTLAEAVNVCTVTRRGRLDKSHSTPAYDNSGEDSDTPPAIEPRKEFLLQTPPIPPPRPRKQKDIVPQAVPPPPPKPPGLMASLSHSSTSAIHVTVDSANSKNANLTAAAGTSTADVCNTSVMKQAATAASPYSPPEPIAEVNELHTPTKMRTLTLKKKHSLISKRRNINLKILGTGDIQGHLYRRTKDRRGVTFWARLYFVMLDTILYGFRSKESLKASSVIFLPGFTVSLAKEVHSKPFAFKVYHSAKTFYFAAESQDALNQWVELIRNAVLQPSPTSGPSHNIGDPTSTSNINTRELFSETDSSGEESESVITKNLCTPSPLGMRDLNVTLSSGSKSCATPTSSTKHERRYLGSLRKFTKGSLPFKSSSNAEKKPSSDIPVPTDQYRSYRKVPGGSFGIQIGTNTPGYPLTSVSQQSAAPMETLTVPRKLSVSSVNSFLVNNAADESLAVCFGPPSSPAPVPHPLVSPLMPSLERAASGESSLDSPGSGKGIKKIPYNFIHASNPNLVEFDFQTSKTLDYSLPKINPSNSWEAHHNIQGFVTLKDLMLQKQEEEAQEMYNNRVLLGVEKKDERKRNAQRYLDGRGQEGGSHQQQPHTEKLSKTQSRSLPKTPDYAFQFNPDDEDIIKTRTKEGLKLRDFGYEQINGDSPIGGANTNLAQRQNSNTSSIGSSGDHGASKPRQFLLIKGKKHSSSSTSSADCGGAVGEKRSGSIRKKGKLEAFKSERMFQFSKHSSGMTMTLPLNKKNSHSAESSGASNGSNGGCIKKSHTYNNDLKLKAGDKYETHRKNSAPIFSKLTGFSGASSSNAAASSSGKSSKEKKLLGSPLLHRTIFGSSHHHHHHQQPSSSTASGNNSPTCTGREYDREIFSQVILPKVPSHHHHQHHCNEQEWRHRNFSSTTTLSSSNTNITAPDVVAPPPPAPPITEREAGGEPGKNPSGNSTAATPEYPNMECPPVFEPGIYSLSDSNASLALLLRRKNSTSGLDEKQ